MLQKKASRLLFEKSYRIIIDMQLDLDENSLKLDNWGEEDERRI